MATAPIGHVIVDSGTITAVTTITNPIAATQSGVWNVTNISGTVSLPTGASTEATLSAINTKVPALGQALAAASVPVVLTAAQLATLTPLTTVSVTNSTLAVTQSGTWTVQPGNTPNTTPWLANPKDPSATTGSITAVDAGTSTTTNSLGQSIVTGSPTANSSVSCTVTGQGTVVLQFKNSGANTCTFALERSTDGGTTFVPMSMEQVSVGAVASSVTTTDANANVLRANVSGMTTLRIRCTSYSTGTVTVNWQPSYEPAQIPVNQGAAAAVTAPWPTQIIPGSTGGLSFNKWISAANTLNTVVKSTPGQLYEIVAASICTSVAYLKLYNANTAPVAGTSTPLWTLPIPAANTGAGIAKTIPEGLCFSLGIGFTLSLGIADSDATNTVANTVVVNLGWK